MTRFRHRRSSARTTSWSSIRSRYSGAQLPSLFRMADGTTSMGCSLAFDDRHIQVYGRLERVRDRAALLGALHQALGALDVRAGGHAQLDGHPDLAEAHHLL